jgi:hypothetical protein
MPNRDERPRAAFLLWSWALGILHGLSVWFPGIAQFSVLQPSHLFLGRLMAIQSFAQLASRNLHTPRTAQ